MDRLIWRVTLVLFAAPAGKPLPQEASASDISFGRFERSLAQFLQVGWLRVDQQFVDRGNLEIINQPEIDSHTYP